MEEYIQNRIGKTLGERWRLESVLGVGGMAAVYLARDAAGQDVAVKVLHPEIGMKPEIRDRFMREGYVANRIQHPGVVRVLEHGAVDEWSVFLVMERLVGESLAERVTRHGTLPVPELLSVMDQVLDVLHVAHGLGIVHRDLKPDNLFVLADGRVKVLDFGLARVMESAPNDVRTRTGMAMGTMPYMAPEQALGKRAEIDGRVDLFALGATAFRILARRRIHESDSDAGMLVAMATQPAPALRSVAPDVSEALAKVVDLALAFNRDARYPDASSMQQDVRALQRGEAPPVATARLAIREEPTRVGGVQAAAAAPGSTPSPASHAPLSAPSSVPTVVTPFGTPTVVAPLGTPTVTGPYGAPGAVAGAAAEPSGAPTVVARLDAATVVRPIEQPTTLGLGPAPAALAASPPVASQAFVTATVPATATALPTTAPRRGRALLAVALTLGVAGLAAAAWLIWPEPTGTSPSAPAVADAVGVAPGAAAKPEAVAPAPAAALDESSARAASARAAVARHASSADRSPTAASANSVAEAAAPAAVAPEATAERADEALGFKATEAASQPSPAAPALPAAQPKPPSDADQPTQPAPKAAPPPPPPAPEPPKSFKPGGSNAHGKPPRPKGPRGKDFR